MTKIALGLAAVAAFFYALWLVANGGALPDSRRSHGFKRRFLLATLLFAGLLSSGWADAQTPRKTCYAPAPPPRQQQDGRATLVSALKAVWITLDAKKGEQFRLMLEKAAGEGKVRPRAGRMLATAFKELAFHQARSSGGPTCYKMTQFGGAMAGVRGSALKQVELLRKARESGAIDAETAAKAHAALAREIEMLDRAGSLRGTSDRAGEDSLVAEHGSGRVVASDSASVAAAMVVEMEGGIVVDFTPARRLAAMKSRVQELLLSGPDCNDWVDPAFAPNVLQILEQCGLIDRAPGVECYLRAASPVAARGEELKKLQEQLLDASVQAGVLDVETAGKVADANARESETDYATEADIRDYQKKVRRAVRLLCRAGEAPPSFVDELERAADVDIAAFDASKALREDVGYRMQVLFARPRPGVKDVLEKLEVIPPVRTHRFMMDWSRNGGQEAEALSEPERKALMDACAKECVLPGDDAVKITGWQVPRTDTEYRMKVRRACRALVAAGRVSLAELQAIEKVIGMPIVGTAEKP